MNPNRIWAILIILLIATGAYAQLQETLQQILGNDTTPTVSTTSTDSALLKQMQEELEAARLTQSGCIQILH